VGFVGIGGEAVGSLRGRYFRSEVVAASRRARRAGTDRGFAVQNGCGR